MTPDGVVPDLHGRRLSAVGLTWPPDADFGLVDPVLTARDATGASVERLRRVRAALRRAQDELLQAHAATVLAMGQGGLDHIRLTDALAEARSQHEALFLVQRAVDVLAMPARPAGE